MNVAFEALAWVGLSGVIVMSVLAPGVGVVMGALLVVGWVDGPQGGRLEARRRARYAQADEVHADPSPARSPA